SPQALPHSAAHNETPQQHCRLMLTPRSRFETPRLARVPCPPLAAAATWILHPAGFLPTATNQSHDVFSTRNSPAAAPAGAAPRVPVVARGGASLGVVAPGR